MIKNIVFDIGNVLTDFDWQGFFAGFGYEEETLRRLGEATVKDPAWNEIDRGVLSDEEILKRFIANAPDLERQLRRIFVNVHGLVKKKDYAIPWIQSLKREGFSCYYLSNFSRKSHEDCMDALGFLEYMDGGILSYQDKLIKPQMEIYRLLLDRYHLKARECVFLDDTERNLPPAREMGFQTILFQNQEQAMKELDNIE